MRKPVLCLTGLVTLTLLLPESLSSAEPPAGVFTRLAPLPAPKIIASAVAYPGGAYEPGNLTDGVARTEYSSEAKGTNTFVEFDFGVAVAVGGFRHVDRNDPATVASSELVFTDAAGQVVASVPVVHANTRRGVTFFALPAPVTAQRVRWRVTGLGPKGYGTVGGAEIGRASCRERV